MSSHDRWIISIPPPRVWVCRVCTRYTHHSRVPSRVSVSEGPSDESRSVVSCRPEGAGADPRVARAREDDDARTRRERSRSTRMYNAFYKTFMSVRARGQRTTEDDGGRVGEEDDEGGDRSIDRSMDGWMDRRARWSMVRWDGVKTDERRRRGSVRDAELGGVRGRDRRRCVGGGKGDQLRVRSRVGTRQRGQVVEGRGEEVGARVRWGERRSEVEMGAMRRRMMRRRSRAGRSILTKTRE